MPTDSRPRSLRRAAPVIEDLEAALVRRSVDALALERPTCHHCGRTPLIGEHVFLYAANHGEETVCALCKPRRSAAPDKTLLVRSEAAGTVRAFRGAARPSAAT